MKHIPYYAISILLFGTLACGVQGANLEPTASPGVPTNTLVPTNTQMPPDTPTALATATPDVAATAAVSATESASDVMSELDRIMSDSDVPYQEGHLAWRQTDQFNIQMTGPEFRILEIDGDLSAANFIFKADVTWEATGLLVCGAIFRSEPNLEEGKQYQFAYLRLSGLPAWSIEVHEFGKYKNSPTDTKTSNALDLRNGSTNQFILLVQDDSFTLYLNGVRQGRYFDYSNQRTSGSFGFMGYQDSGRGGCEFENAWIWSLD